MDVCSYIERNGKTFWSTEADNMKYKAVPQYEHVSLNAIWTVGQFSLDSAYGSIPERSYAGEWIPEIYKQDRKFKEPKKTERPSVCIPIEKKPKVFRDADLIHICSGSHAGRVAVIDRIFLDEVAGVLFGVILGNGERVLLQEGEIALP